MPDSVLFVDLGIDATNDDILDQMRTMKACREDKRYSRIVCTIRSFADDERGLFEIPEVRAFCRRIVNLGFISYLDFSTIIDSTVPAIVRDTWGAAEVWLCGEGRLRSQMPLTSELLDELEQAVGESNEKADAALGPMR
jgi:hypothetical protein